MVRNIRNIRPWNTVLKLKDLAKKKKRSLSQNNCWGKITYHSMVLLPSYSVKHMLSMLSVPINLFVDPQKAMSLCDGEKATALWNVGLILPGQQNTNTTKPAVHQVMFSLYVAMVMNILLISPGLTTYSELI